MSLRAVVSAALLSILATHALARELVVGQLVDYSGKYGEASRDYVAGARTYFDWINARGGVNGLRVRHVVSDVPSGGEGVRAKTRELLDERRAVVLFGFVGDEAVEAAASAMAPGEAVALVGPLAGREAAASAGKVFFTRPSYEAEVRLIVDHFRALQVTRFAVLTAGGDQGRWVGEIFARALARQNLQPVGTFVLGESAQELAAIRRAAPQALIIVADTVPAAEFIKRYRPLDPGAMIVGLSTVNHRTMFELLGPKLAHGVMISQVVPNPAFPDSPLLKEHLDAMRQFRDEPPSHLTLEGFIAAKALIEGVRRAGPAPTREAILVAFQRATRMDLKGFVIDFTPGGRLAASAVDLTMIRRNGALLQ